MNIIIKFDQIEYLSWVYFILHKFYFSKVGISASCKNNIHKNSLVCSSVLHLFKLVIILLFFFRLFQNFYCQSFIIIIFSCYLVNLLLLIFKILFLYSLEQFVSKSIWCSLIKLCLFIFTSACSIFLDYYDFYWHSSSLSMKTSREPKNQSRMISIHAHWNWHSNNCIIIFCNSTYWKMIEPVDVISSSLLNLYFQSRQ